MEDIRINTRDKPVHINRNDQAVINVESETVSYNQPPPPYSFEPPVTRDPTVQFHPPSHTDPSLIHQTVIVQPPLKNGPVSYYCPVCHERVITKVEYVNTRKTHMMAGFICGFTFWCMLCCLAALPYMTSTFKKAIHFCPNCKTFLGVYTKV